MLYSESVQRGHDIAIRNFYKKVTVHLVTSFEYIYVLKIYIQIYILYILCKYSRRQKKFPF